MKDVESAFGWGNAGKCGPGAVWHGLLCQEYMKNSFVLNWKNISSSFK